MTCSLNETVRRGHVPGRRRWRRYPVDQEASAATTWRSARAANDFLFGGGGPGHPARRLGDEPDHLERQRRQRPPTIDGGADADTLTINRTDAAEVIAVNPSGVNVRCVHCCPRTAASWVPEFASARRERPRRGADTVTVLEAWPGRRSQRWRHGLYGNIEDT